MNSYFHDIYFNKHSFNTVRDVELSAVESVTHAQYEDRLRVEMRDGLVLNGRVKDSSPCEEEFYGSLLVPGLLFIRMEHSKDFTSWLALAKCLHIWDLDARGFHKGMWTLRMEGQTVFVIGAPYSPYS